MNYLTSDTEDSAELKEFINDDELEIPEIVIEDNFQEEIFRILKNTNLTDKQINIFLLRCSGKTLAQISSLYGVRKESIRQMETKIKRVLKNDSYIQELCSYYPEYRKYKKYPQSK